MSRPGMLTIVPLRDSMPQEDADLFEIPLKRLRRFHYDGMHRVLILWVRDNTIEGCRMHRSPIDLRDEAIYSAQVLAELLSVSLRTLERWRKTRVGPPYSRLPNGTVRYKGMDVNEWFEKRKPQEHDPG